MVAIIAQHEIFAGRDDEVPVARKALHLSPPGWVDVRVRVNPGGEIVAKRIGCGRFKSSVRFIERNAVHRDSAIFDADVVTRNSHNPLDQIGRIEVVEDCNVAAFNIAIRHQPMNQSLA